MGGQGIPAGVIAGAVAAAQAYLRIGAGEEEALLARLAGSAMAIGEAFCGQALIQRGFVDTIARGGGWQRLAACPVKAIGTVSAIDAAATVLPLAAYGIDIDGDGVGWVRLAGALPAGRIEVRYVAGVAAEWATLPEPLAQGVTALIAHLFDDRASNGVPPAAVAALWRPYRRMRLLVEQRA